MYGQQRSIADTDKGLKKLEAELEELKTVKRREVAQRISASLEFGDISENVEYDDPETGTSLCGRQDHNPGEAAAQRQDHQHR